MPSLNLSFQCGDCGRKEVLFVVEHRLELLVAHILIIRLEVLLIQIHPAIHSGSPDAIASRIAAINSSRVANSFGSIGA